MNTLTIILVVLTVVLLVCVCVLFRLNIRLKTKLDNIQDSIAKANNNMIELEKHIVGTRDMYQKTTNDNILIKNEIKKIQDSFKTINNGFSMPAY